MRFDYIFNFSLIAAFVFESFLIVSEQFLDFASLHVIIPRIIILLLMIVAIMGLAFKKQKTSVDTLVIISDIIVFLFYMLILSLAGVATNVLQSDNFEFLNLFKSSQKQEVISKKDKEINDKVNNIKSDENEENIEHIVFNDLMDFNGMSKEAIFEHRKHMVENSIFASVEYSPSEEVFGQIESDKLWKSMKTEFCIYENQIHDTDGLSEESRFVNNPVLLLSPVPFAGLYRKPENEYICNSEAVNFIPYEILYNREENHIYVYYPSEYFFTELKHLTLTGINARDLGYKYVSLISAQNIEMEMPTLWKDAYELQDFIHVGGSCGHEGGCNNGSPWQKDLDFFIINGDYSRMDFALWKDKPSKPRKDVPDILYTIIFKG